MLRWNAVRPLPGMVLHLWRVPGTSLPSVLRLPVPSHLLFSPVRSAFQFSFCPRSRFACMPSSVAWLPLFPPPCLLGNKKNASEWLNSNAYLSFWVYSYKKEKCEASYITHFAFILIFFVFCFFTIY